jgi:hypothetical protein
MVWGVQVQAATARREAHLQHRKDRLHLHHTHSEAVARSHQQCLEASQAETYERLKARHAAVEARRLKESIQRLAAGKIQVGDVCLLLFICRVVSVLSWLILSAVARVVCTCAVRRLGMVSAMPDVGGVARCGAPTTHSLTPPPPSHRQGWWREQRLHQVLAQFKETSLGAAMDGGSLLLLEGTYAAMEAFMADRHVHRWLKALSAAVQSALGEGGRRTPTQPVQHQYRALLSAVMFINFPGTFNGRESVQC